MNFYDLLKIRAETFGDKIFLQIDERTITFRDFLNAVDNHATGGTGEAILIEALT